MANYSEFNDESFIQAFRSHEAEVIAEHVNVPLYQIIARAASLGLAGEEGVNYKYWKVILRNIMLELYLYWDLTSMIEKMGSCFTLM